MQSFDYTLGCVGGLHARPAGAIVSAAKRFSSDILIRKLSPDGAKEADAKRLISLMSLGARKGDTITFYRLTVDHFHRSPAPGIFRAGSRIMLCNAPDRIRGNAGI